jgi:CRISPR-associated endonuclease Cas2
MRVFMVSEIKPSRSAGSMLIGYLNNVGGELVLSFPDPQIDRDLETVFTTQKGFDKTKFVRVARTLAESGKIILKEKKKQLKLQLNEAGELEAVKDHIDELKLTKPEWWDRKWRVVLFDIPEEKRAARVYFRDKLLDFGCVRLQNSIYAHAYPCHNEIELIRTVYEIKPYVRMMIAERIEAEASLRAHFDLT